MKARILIINQNKDYFGYVKKIRTSRRINNVQTLFGSEEPNNKEFIRFHEKQNI